MTRHLLMWGLLFGLAAASPAADQETHAPAAAPAEARSLKHRLLWYLPNRVLDLADIFRARVRLGPGLAVNVRATRWVTLYAGEYHTAVAGLPGPREQPSLPSLAGLEQAKGLGLLGVDATDDLPHEPHYSNSEFTLGAQLVLVGAEIGFDPVEAADFFLGFFLLDPKKDDH